MPVSLTLLDGVRWHSEPIAGERPAALLVALTQWPAGLSDASLVELVWGDRPPAHPAKALQVLVSRVRTLDRDLVRRTPGGYRLGLEPGAVDAWWLDEQVAAAGEALRSGDPAAAAAAAAAALALPVADGSGLLGELRERARRTRTAAGRVRALALARAGSPQEALPLLLAEHGRGPDDAEVLAELLRAEAVVSGSAAALERYEAYRRDLADRLGADPDPGLQRIQRELLGADRPVRSGLQYGEQLVGRADDLARLRAASAEARLVTILGPGGIGKTSAAQVLAQESTLPRVHVVELVGVASAADVVAEVGAALGVRGSVSGRQTLSQAEQSDVRGRIAAELDGAPTLLVLDNCEHVLEAAAGLVAYLLVTTRDLRVIATSRAPLRISAERVVPLSQLERTDAAELFERRALAVRPDAHLGREDVLAVVDRLDGLPLAIELAAARVRTMTVAEVGVALTDRFAALRSRDRVAPERHRTLAAVIGWSWDLLSVEEQRALAWLSVFHDGFDNGAAADLLGAEGAELVEGLVEQSLLVVSESGQTTRFRALETIREYAAHQLDALGQRGPAEAAQEAWAIRLTTLEESLFLSQDQIRLADLLVREESNLTDVLRRGLARSDTALVARLLSVLSALWTITGDHARIFAITDAAQEVIVAWTPPEELRAVAQDAASVVLLHQSWLGNVSDSELVETLRDWGAPESPWAKAAYALYVDPDPEGALARLRRAATAAASPTEAAMQLMWLSILAENSGDIAESREYARQGLERGPLPPYLSSALHSQLAQLALHAGEHRAAAEHAGQAWPVMWRLHAIDDSRIMRITIAAAHILDGDPDACDRELDAVEADGAPAQLGSRTLLAAARAEALLARGDVEGGLAGYDATVDLVTAHRVTGTGPTPWLALACVGALMAHARYDAERGRDTATRLRDRLQGELATPLRSRGFTDLPFSGLVLVGLASWGITWGEGPQLDLAIEMLAIGSRWGYNRSLPVTAWEPMAERADRARPGLLRAFLDRYAEIVPGDLRPRAAELLTSSG